MRVITSVVLPGSVEDVWPLLCCSKMDPKIPCHFRLGIPKPVECKLPEGEGGVGQRRQCVSNIGQINQRITHWDPPRKLQFEMEDTTLYFRPCVTSIVEEFELVPHANGSTQITRSTTIKIKGFGAWLKGLIMCVGMKFVHRYVFHNWARLVV